MQSSEGGGKRTFPQLIAESLLHLLHRVVFRHYAEDPLRSQGSVDE